MSKPKLFIASSQQSVEVARLIRDRLESDRLADVRIWDEGVFGVGQAILERLLFEVSDYDYAALIWGADDITESKGQSHASPRDNVVFECGLFVGALGRDCVFIVRDRSFDVKIPTDLAGIILADYDGDRVLADGVSAVGRACDAIARQIQRPRFPEFVGEWRTRYARAGEIDHGEVTDDVQIVAARGGILIKNMPAPGVGSYTAFGKVLNSNQVTGRWQHRAGETFAEGLFMLAANTMATVLCGYCTSRDEDGGIAFETWVLVKKAGLSESKISELLHWGENALRGKTIFLPLPEIGRGV
jgi:hypothetical protein